MEYIVLILTFIGLIISLFKDVRTFVFGLFGLSKKEKVDVIVKEEAPDEPIVKMTLEQYETTLKKRESEIRAQLTSPQTPESRALLEAEAAELNRKNADLEGSLKDAQTLIESLKADLGNAESEDAKAAQDALDNNDLNTAREIYERIEARAQPEIETAAKAAYALGEIAKEQVRWHDAAAHYAKAAKLQPNYDRLFAAREFVWRAGDYPNALLLGENLIAAAKSEFGEDSEKLATAFNEHALSLKATGRYEEAEPLYRQAMAIDEKTLGVEHPDYAIDLNNLAGLLEATGRTEEAEPLYRQAVKIFTKALGPDHPSTKTVASNLQDLLDSK